MCFSLISVLGSSPCSWGTVGVGPGLVSIRHHLCPLGQGLGIRRGPLGFAYSAMVCSHSQLSSAQGGLGTVLHAIWYWVFDPLSRGVN